MINNFQLKTFSFVENFKYFEKIP